MMILIQNLCIFRSENYLTIPIERWYGTTKLQTTELPDNDFGPKQFQPKIYPDNDSGPKQIPIRNIPNYYVPNDMETTKLPDDDSGLRQIPIRNYLIDRDKFQSKQINNNNLPLLVLITTTTTTDRGERDITFWRRYVITLYTWNKIWGRV